MTVRPKNQRPSGSRGTRLGLLGVATALSAASLVIEELSIPAILLTLIAAMALPTLSPNMRHFAYALLGISGVVASVALIRFAKGRAMTGIVEAGQRATAKSAIWRLREIVLAQDGLRKSARIDPDGDGIGSASFIGGLTGREPLRGEHRADAPLLNYRYRRTVETAAGLAAHVGSHLVIVCLPAQGGGFTSRSTDVVDEEAAERRFLVYAWPSDDAPDVHDVAFVDEHERILELDGPTSPYRGAKAPPPCTAALEPTERRWAAWKNKAPRQRLPGDR
jgi:hypothetical protein